MSSLYKISFDENEGIVEVTVSGKAKHEDHLAARDEACRICSEKNCSKLIVDLNNLDTECSSTMDCFSFGTSFADKLPEIQVAYIMPKEKNQHQMCGSPQRFKKIGESIAKNLRILRKPGNGFLKKIIFNWLIFVY